MPQRAALSAALIAVATAEITARASGVRLVQEAAWIAMGVVIVLTFPRLTLRDRYLLAVSAVLSVLAFVRLDDWQAILSAALDQASFLMTFILLIGLLNAAADTSPSVATLGAYLTRQPPGRRYSALNAGTGLLAILFNVGIVSLLVPLIRNGIERAAPGDALNPIRERRQLTAMLRGFAWSVTWSPTAIAPLVVIELIPEANRQVWIVYGLAVSVLILLVGWQEDNWRFRAYRPKGVRPVMAFPGTAARDFAITCLAFFALISAVIWLSGDTFVFALLVSCPIMVTGWLVTQTGLSGLGARLRGIVRDDLPTSANVAITLACSGFIGRAAAAQIPAAELAAALHLDAMPDWLLLSLIPPVLWAVSLLALSPTMLAVFFGSLFAALPVLPADATLIAFAISCGWGLSMTLSPFATVVLIVERIAGIPATRLTFGWNTLFTILVALLLFPCFAVMTGGQ